jgi:membrane protein implicated in regulation of membrane protease activity
MSESAKVVWLVIGVAVVAALLILVNVFLVWAALSVGLPTIAAQLGLAYHGVGFWGAVNVWAMLTLLRLATSRVTVRRQDQA